MIAILFQLWSLFSLVAGDYHNDNQTTIDMKLTPEQEQWFFTPQEKLTNDMLTKGVDATIAKWYQYYDMKNQIYKIPILVNSDDYQEWQLPILWSSLLWTRRQYQLYTNIKIIFIDPTQAEKTFKQGYINLFNRGNCWSYVGNLYPQYDMKSQDMDVGWCYRYRGSILHETLHALGFVHEHMRYDRDKYINVGSSDSANCAAFREGSLDVSGTAYDLDSILHYPVGTGCKISLKNPEKYPGKKIGQRERLSKLDIKEINTIYPKELL